VLPACPCRADLRGNDRLGLAWAFAEALAVIMRGI
jgi:hypothetical protein